jgi:ribosomal-protein-alanine N-acetyltransferase
MESHWVERLMSSEICFRDYRATDLEAIFRLDEVCFTKEFRFDQSSMSAFAADRDAITLIAEDRGEVIGFVIAHVKHVDTERRAYIVTLDVAPEWRRKGLAGELMSEVEARASAQGARRIQLHVFAGNNPAIRFYERLGYERVRIVRKYYGAGLDAIVYGKDLHDQ